MTILVRHYGFKRVGEFSLPEKHARRALHLDLVALPRVPAVYAFVVGRKVMYVGASCSLRSRMYDYCTIGHGAACRDRVVQSLKRGERVRVLALHPKRRSWNGLNISVVLPIEAALIGRLTPPWNKTRGDQTPRALRGLVQ